MHWTGVFANMDFVEGFAPKFWPLVMTQEVKLLTAAPWGPHPQLLRPRISTTLLAMRRGERVRGFYCTARARNWHEARNCRGGVGYFALRSI